LEKRILIVDDDDPIRTLLLTVLRKRGFHVDSARNGEEAIEKTRQCRYSVVLLDLMMPRMSGYEFLERVEEWPAEQRPLVLVLTAGSEPRDLNPDIVAGTIHKPFDVELLVDTIEACIRTLDGFAQRDNCPPSDSDLDNIGKPN
jgi:two-component system OmpR family response regulator